CFVCITAHWITETWEYKKIVLDFVRVVERFGLQQKILAITTNNASNVKSMAKLLQQHTEDASNGWYAM
ncbi:hypothetical protein BGZ79_004583, partial [Entomortierella chlamydospora]